MPKQRFCECGNHLQPRKQFCADCIKKHHNARTSKWYYENKHLVQARMRKYERTLARKTSPNKRYNQLKMNAKAKDRELALTFERFLDITNRPCHYCSDFLCQDRTGTRIDRRDNSKGYTVENSVPCCKFCNCIKQELFTEEETIVMVKSLIDFRIANTQA